MTDRELLQQALEWVEWFASDDHSVRPTKRASETAEAIKARLAHPKKEWVGLTDEELTEMRRKIQEYMPMDYIQYGLTIQNAMEEKLKEKNDLG
jgi:hypothetical protein